jgi:hypothetical protein
VRAILTTLRHEAVSVAQLSVPAGEACMRTASSNSTSSDRTRWRPSYAKATNAYAGEAERR